MNIFSENKESIEMKRKLFEKNRILVNIIEKIKKLKDLQQDADSDTGELEEKLIMEETTSEFERENFDAEKFMEAAKKNALKNIENPDNKKVVSIEDIRKRKIGRAHV